MIRILKKGVFGPKASRLAVLGAFCLLLSGTGALAAGCTLSKADLAIAAKTLQLTNAERRRKGLAPLKRDARIQAAAQAHACDMMRKGYFSHRSKDGSDFSRRLQRQGCRPGYAGENIAVGQRTAQEVMRGWMNSPGHRKNILLGHGVDRFGLGLARHRKGYYWVMMFAKGC